MRKWLFTFILAGAAAALPSETLAYGVASRFTDITLEMVDPGLSVNLRVLKNLPMIIRNLDDVNGADVLVESVVPNGDEMKDGYSPIPNPDWIQIVPRRFHLGPAASASADIVVTIPDDKKLIGHHYEGIVWVHTEHKRLPTDTGVFVETGLRHRIRMSIGVMGPESLQREKMLKKLATINTNFSISPDNLFVEDVALGMTVDLKSQRKSTLKVINESDEPVELKIKPVPADPNIVPQAGYKYTPDPKWITVDPSRVKVPGNSIKAFQLRVMIPDKPENRNQKYMFLLQTSLADESVPLQYYNMIYVATTP
jgi:hypothetical protein